MRYKILFFILFLLSLSVDAKKICEEPYKNPNLSIKVRVSDLLSRMTLEEKLLQLSQLVLRDNNINNVSNNHRERKIPLGIGSLIYFHDNADMRNKIQKDNMTKTRLGIPVLFGFDVIHGFKKIYPIPLAQACSWSPELSKELSKLAAYEAYIAGINWTFSPMIDVSRDPRWGRIAECYGEDPYVNSVFGCAAVKGYQGESDDERYTIASCLKHYVGYAASEGGRDYRYTEISAQSLWDTYLPPYKACIEAGASTLMSGFNDISGIPATCNYYTLTEILRNRWNFNGFVVSDWNAVEQLIYQGVAQDKKEAGLKAFLAGVDMDMRDMVYYDNFTELVNNGTIDISLIDRSVERILTLKFKLGLFDKPYTEDIRCEKIESFASSLCEKMAEESYVLLKNNNILPLSDSVKSIALIGPMAKNRENLLGSWSAAGDSSEVESLYDGIVYEYGNKIKINYSLGSTFTEINNEMLYEAKKIALNSDVILLCLGEMKTWSGENASRSSISLPESQELLVKEMSNLGKPIVLILSSGRPLELRRIEPIADAILEIWQPGIAGGKPFAGIISGRINPSGKLSITFPFSTGQIPIYYNMRQCARPFDNLGNYQDIQTSPLYEFGHGLSYTKYISSDIKILKKEFSRNEKFNVEIDIKNIGERGGKETVFWYVTDPFSSISRPVKELKFFEKKYIAPGEIKKYVFEVDPMRDLSFVDNNGNRILEKGDYIIKAYGKELKIKIID